MKTSLRKLGRFALHRQVDATERRYLRSLSKLDELAQASQVPSSFSAQARRDGTVRSPVGIELLHSYPHWTSNCLHAFSRGFFDAYLLCPNFTSYCS